MRSLTEASEAQPEKRIAESDAIPASLSDTEMKRLLSVMEQSMISSLSNLARMFAKTPEGGSSVAGLSR
jgi:hypothetical protein